MAKKKNKKPTTFVTASLGLFYLRIEHDGVEADVVGPFKTLAEAEEEQAKQKKLSKKD
ncbi:hypothetical protein LJR231_005982 [Phyllobacterium sp. LjRoot231]|uniref:hypothetical protein n=1 Tax=Phyllobacterium sp. LjRoot231 TaxID=3342289 RepID=UPI003ECC236B